MAIVCYTCAIQVVNLIVEKFKSFTLLKACTAGSPNFFLVAKTADSTTPASTHITLLLSRPKLSLPKILFFSNPKILKP